MRFACVGVWSVCAKMALHSQHELVIELAEPRNHVGRAAGTPNRDKAELRALIQERVHEFTELRRAADIAQGIEPEKAQEVVEDYDPVVQLAIFSIDRRSTIDQRLRASAEVAQYVRPKLKSIEVRASEDDLAELRERQTNAEKIYSLLERLDVAGVAGGEE